MRYVEASQIEAGDEISVGDRGSSLVAKKHGYRVKGEDFKRYKIVLENGRKIRARENYRLPVVSR